MDGKITRRKLTAGGLGAVVGALSAMKAGAQSMPPPGGSGSGISGADMSEYEKTTLYQSALGNADVSLLLLTLPGAVRLDPPADAVIASVVNSPGNTANTIICPVISLATQETVAKVTFGWSSQASVTDGGRRYVQVAAMTTRAGKTFLAGGGKVAPSDRPEFDRGLHQGLFPVDFAIARLNQRVNPANHTPIIPKDADWQFRACVDNVENVYRQCCHQTRQELIAAVVLSLICVACALGAAGPVIVVIVVVPLPAGTPPPRPSPYLCFSVCGAALYFWLRAYNNWVYCDATYDIMLQQCYLQWQYRQQVKK